MAGVRSVAGDYNVADLELAVRRSVLVGDIIQHYLDRAPGRRGIYFTVSVAYSRELAATFRDAGIPAEHIDGKHSTAHRLEAARRFALGETMILTNCSLFSEGYDLSSQAGIEANVEMVGLLRPTQSLALHIQQMGRSLRPKPYPAIILDHVGNVLRHGLPDTGHDWTLDGTRL
jgi:DNA repair protein RadD